MDSAPFLTLAQAAWNALQEDMRAVSDSDSVVFRKRLKTHFFMVALCNRADHYIFALWFLSDLLLSFFIPRLILAATDWMPTILLHMAWP